MVKAALLLVSLLLVVALIETANGYWDRALNEGLKGSEIEDREKTFEDMMDEALISSKMEKNEMATTMRRGNNYILALFYALSRHPLGRRIITRRYCRQFNG